MLFGSCKVSKSSQKNYLGSYYNSYSGLVSYRINISSNNVFTYRLRGHTCSDTSAGIYWIENDTLFLKYYLNNYDSLFKVYKEANMPIPVEMALNCGTNRPSKYLWRHNKLYNIDKGSGKVLKSFLVWQY